MAILTVDLPPICPGESFTANNCKVIIQDIKPHDSPFSPVFRGAWMSHNILTVEILHHLNKNSTQALVVVNTDTGERVMVEMA